MQTNTLQAIPDFDDSILKYQKKFYVALVVSTPSSVQGNSKCQPDYSIFQSLHT